MKQTSSMIRFTYLLAFLFILLSPPVNAQQYGLLPFTGATYKAEGIWAKKINIELDGKTWTSNKLPIRTELKIILDKPTGFLKDKNGRYHPGLELLIQNTNKDTIGYAANMMNDPGNTGLNEFQFENLKFTLGFNEKSKPGDTAVLSIRFFDQKSKHHLKFTLPVIIVANELPLENTASTYIVKSDTGLEGMATGIEMKQLQSYWDSIYYPKSLYYNLRAVALENITAKEINEGSFFTWIIDKNGNEIKPAVKPEKIAKQYAAKTNKDGEAINLLVTIPLNPSDALNKSYSIRYRWQSNDNKKIIDIVSRIN